MWFSISQIILRNRTAILIILGLLTAFFAYFAITNVKIDNKFANILPKSDPVRADHEQLKAMFGEDGSVVVVGVSGVNLFEKERFNAWYEMGNDLKKIEGVDSVFSVAHMYLLQPDHDGKEFTVKPVMTRKAQTEAEVDSILKKVMNVPFYDGLLYNEQENINLMMIHINAERFNSQDRGQEIQKIRKTVETYSEFFPTVHYSGLPFIREVVTKNVAAELGMFVILAMGVTALILFLFFRSIKVVIACMLVVSVGVTWAFGTMGLFNYKVTLLMGLVPPVLIVIGIPNCIFLLNKYHSEYRKHGNKVRALSRIIQKIGNATFLTNTTTSLGFAAFVFTRSTKMQEFGVVASINIIAIFFISLCLIPIIFSFLNPPSDKHTKHLEKKWIDMTVARLQGMVTGNRNLVYIVTLAVLIASGIGMNMMVTTGNIASDLPQGNPVLEDLEYFEKHFGGIMPFEIVINTKDKNRAFDNDVLKKIDRVQQVFPEIQINEKPVFSKSLSIADAVKFANYSIFQDSSSYTLDLSGRDRARLKRYIENSADSTTQFRNSFLADSGRLTRISVQIADIGSREMERLISKVSPVLDTILNPNQPYLDSVAHVVANKPEQRDSAYASLYERFPAFKWKLEEYLIKKDSKLADRFVEEQDLIFQYHDDPGLIDKTKELVSNNELEYTITGVSVVLAQSTSYMVSNLLTSIIIAILVISVIMSLLFRSVRMVIVSLLPNFIPLLCTAGIMGFAGIPIKPSTILVFSIAFGISVDDTIHFLAKYRQEIKHKPWDIRGSTLVALRETGISMIYTSIMLFFGFIMFTLSSFGGTIALGLLVSITLFIAMLANLVVLPSLLLSMQKLLTTKAFKKEPLLEIVDEEDDIDLKGLSIEGKEDKSEQETKPTEK